MNDRDILRAERLERVATFHRDHTADFVSGGLAATLFGRVDALLRQLDGAKVGQLRSPVSKATLLDALRLDLRDIARTARAIHLADPTFPVGDYSPAPNDNAETPLLTRADAVLARLEDRPDDTPAQTAAKAALRARFLALEIAGDFVEDLRADRDAIDSANETKISDNREGVESTSAIGTLLADGHTLVLQLDAIVRNKYARNPDKLHAWQRASRVERRPRPATPAAGGSQPA